VAAAWRKLRFRACQMPGSLFALNGIDFIFYLLEMKISNSLVCKLQFPADDGRM
jgi:hypothetical protein